MSGEPVRPAPVVGARPIVPGAERRELLSLVGSLVGVGPDTLPGRQEVDLGAAGYQPFAGVEHLTTVPSIGGDHTYALLMAPIMHFAAAHAPVPGEVRGTRAPRSA